jgi:hypothetical protein
MDFPIRPEEMIDIVVGRYVGKQLAMHLGHGGAM